MFVNCAFGRNPKPHTTPHTHPHTPQKKHTPSSTLRPHFDYLFYSSGPSKLFIYTPKKTPHPQTNTETLEKDSSFSLVLCNFLIYLNYWPGKPVTEKITKTMK